MTLTTENVYFDMYDRGIYADPYPVFQRLRDEAPLYFNEQMGFYAVSRFEDAERVMVDRETFVSSKGMVYNIMPYVIGGDVAIPNGLFICEDAPIHTMHRSLVSRVFTPKRVNLIEPQIRAFCAGVVDRLIGADRFDWAKDIAAQVPMRVIGMLVGIPEEDQEKIRDHFNELLNEGTLDSTKSPFEALAQSEGLFGAHLDRRTTQPSDDLMTQLLTIEFRGQHGSPAQPAERGDPHLPEPHRQRRDRYDQPPHRVDRQNSRRAPRSASPVGRKPVFDSERHRGDTSPRAPALPLRALRDQGRGYPRSDGAGWEHHGCSARIGQPRRAPIL